ncbi:hypothetical protein AB4Z10_17185 [Bosea sp. RAF48]|uniref:hypothetical protein n=1 Tax=Bosea sp. RAF48 TaxID=3237480 RepID=UPI003F91FEED
MPFLSLTDPADLARAYAALEAVWDEVKRSIPEPEHERERTRIACLVAGFAPLALDEEDLKQNVLLHYNHSVLS